MDLVRARQVDVIVVYKVDRLTRSLADFAKLVELFDEYDVSFVSVTQSFNTTSSMGRLTLNVLLSFAQFEREVIGERVRDKIAASKRKGIWVGGPVPLGYRSVDKKLEIVPEEAALVRKIFMDYLHLGSIATLAASLRAEGLRPKPKKSSANSPAPQFGVGALFYLLKNRIHVGEIAYRGETFKGEQPAILDRETFDAVQQKLKEQSIGRNAVRQASPSLLAGKIFDDRGNPMSPAHANKKGVRYRYYVSQALLQGRKLDAGSVPRVSAPDVETLVMAALRREHSESETRVREADRDLVDRLLNRAVVNRQSISIYLRPETRVENGESQEEGNPITSPFMPALPVRKGVVHRPPDAGALSDEARTALLAAIARAKAWIAEIQRDPSLGFSDIAAREGLGAAYLRRLAALAYLSPPPLVEAIAEGSGGADLTPTKLLGDLPLNWAEQEERYLSA
ncbi:recombinase family protein [Methylocystis parvus]|uniref:recombinase family protein n=1 Tax=Methylocystis parvus TaxID=134 RepID=UPI003C725BB0